MAVTAPMNTEITRMRGREATPMRNICWTSRPGFLNASGRRRASCMESTVTSPRFSRGTDRRRSTRSPVLSRKALIGGFAATGLKPRHLGFAGRVIDERGVIGNEGDGHFAGGPVALLGQDDLP